MMLFLYPSKKVLKENVGKQLRFRETSMFGAEYRSTGKFVGANKLKQTLNKMTVREMLVHKRNKFRSL